jgi:predicted nicotinamide N-methyase
MMMPRLHSTPPDAFRERVRESISICGRTYQFDRPLGLDKLFDHPAVRSAYDADEYIPYWADLWPAARMLAETIVQEPWSERSATGDKLEALEIGCGLGLSGIVALACGLRVTFSDVDEAAVQLAASNARLNGFHDFETAAIDLRATPDRRFPVLLAADICYEIRLTEAAAKFIAAALAPGGLALVTDTDRYSARSFRWQLEQAGMKVTVTPKKTGEPGNQSKGYLYRITHNGSGSELQ